MARKPVEFVAIDPDGVEHRGVGVYAFCKEHGIPSPGRVSMCLSGKLQSHKRWRFYKDGGQPELTDKSPVTTEVDHKNYGDDGPPERIDGVLNVERLRWKYKTVTDLMMSAALGNAEIPKNFNFDQARKLLDDEARNIYGIDPKHLIDQRTDAEKMLDAIDRFEQAPESLLEIAKDEIDAIERSMATAVKEAKGYAHELEQGVRNKEGPKVSRERLQVWLSLIQQVMRLRSWARNPLPPKKDRAFLDLELLDGSDDHLDEVAWEASRLLRMTTYVGRSTMRTTATVKASGTVYNWARCHAKASLDIWVARNGVSLTKKYGYRKGRIQYKGIILIMPPGHGKTTIGDHWCLEVISDDPREMGALLHAQEDKSKDSLKYVADCMNATNASGRRYKAIFPEVSRASRDNNAKTLKLQTRDASKSPTLEAFGVGSAGLGHDTTFQKWDDVVPQSDVSEPTVRARRYETLTGTFATRQRGEHTFLFMTGYFWHHADALSRMYSDARKAFKNQGGVRYVVSKQICGGPKTTPKFAPLWKEAYPARELKVRYRQLTPRIYAANYMGDPRADEAQIIKKVRLYDQSSDQHRDFLKAAEMHVSLDPAGTNRKGSDSAGIIRAAVGEIRRWNEQEMCDEFVNRIRVVGAKQIAASQHELVKYVVAEGAERRIDFIHVEVTSGFYATADGFRELGIQGVIEHRPGMKDKEVRLRNVASMIDDSHADLEAVVEFPGIPALDDKGNEVYLRGDDGEVKGRKLEPDPEYKALFTQVLDFGVAADDHLIDPLVHLCKHLAPDVGVGDGAVSRMIREVIHKPRNRMAEELAQFKRNFDQNSEKSADEEDAEFVGVRV